MKFYAYVQDSHGKEPVGGDRRLIFELKTERGAYNRALRCLGDRFTLQTYSNFYDDQTFRTIAIHG